MKGVRVGSLVLSVGRQHLRSLVVMAVVIGISGAAVLAAVAGARRSASSVERFEAAAHEMDVHITVEASDVGPLRPVLESPLVESFTELKFVFAVPRGQPVDSTFFFAPVNPEPSPVARGLLLDGRWVDPAKPDEVVVFETTARQVGVGVGDTLVIETFSPAELAALLESGEDPGAPDGPVVPLHVVGLARNMMDLGARPGDTSDLILSPAFLERYGADVGVADTVVVFVDLGDDESFPTLSREISEAYEESAVPSLDGGNATQTVTDSIAVISWALAVFALVVALAAMTWISTGIARHQRRAADDVAVMRTLGVTQNEARLILAAAIAPALAVGIAISGIAAAALSALLPVGLARRAEPDPGLHLDVTVVVGGAFVFFVLLAVVTWISAWRIVGTSAADRGAPAAGRVLDRAIRGLSPALRTGVRFAFASPRSGSARARPALAGATLAVVGLVAVAVVASGLERLLVTPARWGSTWDVSVAPDALDRQTLLENPEVAAAALGTFDDRVAVAGHETLAMVLEPVKGMVLPSLVAGREPRGEDEVAIGQDTADAIGAGIGSDLEVRSATELGQFRVVGVVAFASEGQFPLALADGAAFSASGAERMKIGDPAREDRGLKRLLLRWAPGVDHDAALERIGGEQLDAAVPSPPQEVTRLRGVRSFPAAIAATLAFLGAIAVGHGLATTVRRRRREPRHPHRPRVCGRATSARHRDAGHKRGGSGAPGRDPARPFGGQADLVRHRRINRRGRRRESPAPPAGHGGGRLRARLQPDRRRPRVDRRSPSRRRCPPRRVTGTDSVDGDPLPGGRDTPSSK